MITPGYEYAPVTPISIYDDRMMLATVAAAKDMYDKAEKKLDDFYEKYSDFDSPIPGANKAWDQATRGYMEKQLNDMEAKYGDPLKSKEGRIELQRAINNAPVKLMNKLKSDTKNYEKWQKSVDDAKAKGLFNEDFYKYQLKEAELDNYTPEGKKAWSLTSYIPFDSMQDRVAPMVKGMQDTELDTIVDPTTGVLMRNRGISRDMVRQTIQPQIEERLKNDPITQFELKKYTELAQKHNANRPEGSPAVTGMDLYLDDMIDASHMVRSKYDYDEADIQRAKFENDKKLYNIRYNDGGGGKDGNKYSDGSEITYFDRAVWNSAYGPNTSPAQSTPEDWTNGKIVKQLEENQGEIVNHRLKGTDVVSVVPGSVASYAQRHGMKLGDVRPANYDQSLDNTYSETEIASFMVGRDHKSHKNSVKWSRTVSANGGPVKTVNDIVEYNKTDSPNFDWQDTGNDFAVRTEHGVDIYRVEVGYEKESEKDRKTGNIVTRLTGRKTYRFRRTAQGQLSNTPHKATPTEGASKADKINTAVHRTTT